MKNVPIEYNGENKQNVTVRYKYIFGSIDNFKIPDGYKNDEVDELKWININDINDYIWAFEHDIIIRGIA